MSVATQIQRIQSAKGTIKSAIEAKGVTVPSGATLDTYGTYIGSIETGGSGSDITGLKKWFEGTSTTLPIPEGVTKIGEGVLMGGKMASIVFPNTLKTIAKQSFYACSNLTSIDIPDSVTSIGHDAFSQCTKLKTITIGSGLSAIYYEGAFRSSTAIESITVSTENATYDSRENCNAIIRKSDNVLIQGCKNTVIPNTVQEIGQDAFYQCSGLTSITIPDSVTYISSDAFMYCRGLTSITIPDSVETIMLRAFKACTSLTSVTIGTGLKNIWTDAFNGCTLLTSITVKATTPPSMTNYAFGDTNNCPIYVPSESVSRYKSASGWSSYADRIQAIPTE